MVKSLIQITAAGRENKLGIQHIVSNKLSIAPHPAKKRVSISISTMARMSFDFFIDPSRMTVNKEKTGDNFQRAQRLKGFCKRDIQLCYSPIITRFIRDCYQIAIKKPDSSQLAAVCRGICQS